VSAKVLPPFDLEAVLASAASAAEAAGEQVMARFRAIDLQIDGKGDGSPVSEADRAAEQLIRQHLGAAFPHIDIFGEEQGYSDTGSSYRFVVDPIDGTLSFISGIPLFGTLIGIEERNSGQAIGGVLHLPGLGETYVGGPGLGLRCNHQQLPNIDQRRGRAQDQPDNPFAAEIISAGDPLQFHNAGCPQDHARLSQKPLFRGYSDCFGHAMVLRGAVGAMVDPALAPWDLVASTALVRAAGGTVFTRQSKLAGHTDAILGRPDLVTALSLELGWRTS
tara:strand:- start:739 stop:1569 length:831 start_codon:yes stop_codon:yes gene_type:complete